MGDRRPGEHRGRRVPAFGNGRGASACRLRGSATPGAPRARTDDRPFAPSLSKGRNAVRATARVLREAPGARGPARCSAVRGGGACRRRAVAPVAAEPRSRRVASPWGVGRLQEIQSCLSDPLPRSSERRPGRRDVRPSTGSGRTDACKAVEVHGAASGRLLQRSGCARISPGEGPHSPRAGSGATRGRGARRAPRRAPRRAAGPEARARRVRAPPPGRTPSRDSMRHRRS